MSYKTKKEKKKRTTKQKIFLAIKVTLAVAFLAILGVCLKYGLILYGYMVEADNLVNTKGIEAFTQSLTTTVYDVDGDVIAKLSGDKEAYYLEFSDIPYMVKEIFLVTEDRSFYEHSGIDYKSIFRAFMVLIQNEGEVTQGGSTITQQLARNIYLSHEVSLTRKIKEMFIARELEKTYTKDEILEFYINNICFGNGYYGIESASEGYFNTDIHKLSLSQTAFLCAIPNNPTLYDPFTNMDNTIKRRDRILKQLFDAGIINLEDYEGALKETIKLESKQKIKNNYVETFIRYTATKELMKLQGFVFRENFSNDEEKEEYTQEYNRVYSECNALLFIGGYEIYTSIDMQMQQKLQNEVDERLSVSDETNEEGIYSMQGSATCIDNSTGYVVAVVGGREQEYEGYTLNRAYQSFRQPGSSIKPILIYTPLFERNFTPDSLVIDEKIVGGPVNSPNTYAGEITIRTAVVLSKNTIAWKMFEKIGYKSCINYLLNMNFTHIVQRDYVPAMSIGGMTYGVSTYEMASAYATIANDGVYRNPTCIVKIIDSFGNEILNNDNNSNDSKVIYRENAARTMTNVLKDVLNWGTGKNYGIENAICAGKTGTTNDNKDSWFVGYSKYYTTAIWCGYDMPREMGSDLISASGQIWKNYMGQIHEGLEMVDFIDYKKDIKQEETSTLEETIPTEETSENESNENETSEEETSEHEEVTEETPTNPEGETGDELETGIYIPDDL